MVIEMAKINSNDVFKLIDSLGTKDIDFMKDLLKELAQIDLYEETSLEESDELLEDQDKKYYSYFDMALKIDESINYYRNTEEEKKKNKKRRFN